MKLYTIHRRLLHSARIGGVVLRLLLVCNTAFGASFASAQNLLLGATVTDTCMACPQEQFGPPGAITDGDMKTNRNLGGGAPGSFMISLAQPIALGRVVLFPNMTPNGPVSFEIQTSSDPAGSTGTWTSHGGSITRGWVDKQAIDVPLNPSTTGVRKVKVIVYKSPAWVSFYEVEGYSSHSARLLFLLALPPLLVAGGFFYRRRWGKRGLLKTTGDIPSVPFFRDSSLSLHSLPSNAPRFPSRGPVDICSSAAKKQMLNPCVRQDGHPRTDPNGLSTMASSHLLRAYP